MFKLLISTLFASVLALSPGEIAEIIRQKQKKAATMIKVEELSPACGLIECADITESCTNLDIVWNQGQCCPVCSSPGYNTERLDTDLGFRAVAQATTADPALCRDVRCFKLVCEPGKKPSAPSGGCCNVCK